jgi:microcystin-dependent protein
LTDVASDDLLVVVDKSDTSMADSGTDKKVQKSNLIKDTVPAGVVDMFAGSTAPSGYLLCDGSAVSRTTYSKLFTAIGTTYGAGDGSTTFNVPNLKGKVAVGLDSADTSFDALGETGGEKTHTLSVAEMPSHSHSKTVIPKDTQWVAPSQGWNYSFTDGTTYTQNTDNTGGDGAHNNLQPYIVLNYIIKT